MAKTKTNAPGDDTIWPSEIFSGAPDPEDTFAFLREQAREVTNLSGGLLAAELTLIPAGNHLAGYFNVRLPSRDNYTVRLFSVTSSGLPTQLSSDHDEDLILEANTFSDFKDAVVSIMSSPNMKRLLRNLLQQAEGKTAVRRRARRR